MIYDTCFAAEEAAKAGSLKTNNLVRVYCLSRSQFTATLGEILGQYKLLGTYHQGIRVDLPKIELPQVTPEAQTVAEFVAEFFLNQSEGIDYSEDLDVEGWNGYVAVVATAGLVLEAVAQMAAHEQPGIDSWYDVLEESAKVFRELLVKAKGDPDHQELVAAFTQIVNNHLNI